jgi:hypothetical protein
VLRCWSQGPQSAARDAVGRWGEALVAALLRASQAAGGAHVEWVNERSESFLP